VTYVNLPASPAARRAEEAARDRARLEQIDLKTSALVDLTYNKGEPSGSSTTPSYTDQDIEDLAERLAEDDGRYLPRGSTVSKTTRWFGGDEEYRTLATRVTLYPLQPMTIEEALACGVLDTSGRLVRHVYERLVAAEPDRVERVVRPHEAAAVAAPRPRY
jgi:hypothetical protein